ncbi:MAG TPA: hypothetical protein VGN83_15200 [Falsiroseomonas sp.]|jgi:hypothetical protein|nr:hypothetical protein [Falsiroseomonas sp.]
MSGEEAGHRAGALDARMDTGCARMDRLEARMAGFEERLYLVGQQLEDVSAKLDLLTTRIVAKLPSWWQMPAVIGSTVVLLGALWAAGRWMAKFGYF